MRAVLVIPLAIAAIAGARFARQTAASTRAEERTPAPYAPSPAAAPIVFLGYREAAADLMYVRLVGYFAATDSDPAVSGSIAEAMAALDPQLRPTYELGAMAMTDARRTPDHALQLRAVKLLEQGMHEFPDYWRFPSLAGAIYLVELTTDDPAQRHEWDERGALLLESASRKPNAPAELGLQSAILRTRLGQQQRAIATLKEMLLITSDARARESLLAELAKITSESSDELAAEMSFARKELDRTWKHDRAAVPLTFYLLIGKPLGTRFDLGDLATGGRDLIGTSGFESLTTP